ncbi:MAG TPA: zincin-like metallopeptidase domain-containing protein [Saprospiraceae bacterium]|nr:zincin-like metallopeptidase domain-containing protein [Saprospiraceae bacterium]
MEKNNQSNGQSNLYLAVTNQIVELLESQKLTWNKPWITLSKDGKRPHNAVSGRTYSGLNQILLSLKQMKSNYLYSGWMTFKQIQDEGGRVLAGNKASSIFYYKLMYSDNMGRKHELAQVLQMSLNEQQDLELRKHSILLYYNVFNLTQTSGLPDIYYDLNERPLLPEVEKDETAENLITNTKARIIYMEGNEARYNYVNDVIFMPERNQFTGIAPFYETVLHELAHWTGHKSRLDRSLKNVFGSDEYAKEELIAELCSAFLCADLGFSLGITNSAAYIQDWIRVLKADSRFIFKAIRGAEEASNYIHSCGKTNTEFEAIKDESSTE